MSIYEDLKSIFTFDKGKNRNRDSDPKEAKARASIGLETAGNFPNSSAWTSSKINYVRAYKHWVYVAISTIAEKIASQLPNVGNLVQDVDPDLEKYKDIHNRNNYVKSFQRKALTPLHYQETIEPVRPIHPLVKVLNDPNEPDTSYDLWYETVLFLLLTGTAYWKVTRNPVTGIPIAIWVLPSHWVWPVPSPENFIEYYEIRPTEGNYLRTAIPASDIIRFTKKSPVSKIDGMSPLNACENWVDSASSIDRSRNAHFKNGAFPSTVLEFDPNYSDPSEDDLIRIEKKFMARYSGEVKAGKPLLLPPGVKFHNISVRPREMDYNSSAEQIRDSILAAFKVPLAIVGLNKDMTHGGNVAAQGAFFSQAINPLFRYFGQVLTEKLAKPIDESLRIWWDDMTPEDETKVEEKLKTDMSLGALTPNELRIIRGRHPYKFGGDNPILPNMGIVLPYGNGQKENYLNDYNEVDKPSEESEKPTEEKPKETDNE